MIKGQVRQYLIWIVFFLFVVNMHTSMAAERVVSLAASITKNIYLLNAQDMLVGCTSYCTIAVNDKKTVIGSAVAINLEKILMLDPDLILATGITNPETIESFRNMGIEVIVFESPNGFDGICDQLIELGNVLDKQSNAFRIVESEKNKVSALVGKVIAKKPVKIFFQIGSNPVFTVLTNTFMDDFILMARGENIFKELTSGTVSREQVVLRNPDVILVSDMGGIGYEEKGTWETFGEMSAVKRKNIIIVDSDKSCSPTVSDFSATLKFIIESINY